MHRIVSAAAATLLFALAPLAQGNTAEISILAPGSTEGVLKVLLPRFERTSGLKITISYGPVGRQAARVRKGAAADIVILSAPVAERLRKEGKTIDGSQTVIAKVGIGVFVRRGDPKPDIKTADAFLHALAAARKIAYADPKLGGSSSILVDKLLRSLDVTGSIRSKAKLVPPAKPLVDLVAAGGIDFGFQPISQIYLDHRIELVGPIPPPYQHYTQYVASLVKTSKQSRFYDPLIKFMTSPEATAVWKSKGFESH